MVGLPRIPAHERSLAMETVYQMFGPCKTDEHDDCSAEIYVDHNDGKLSGHFIVCGCECHVGAGGGEDRHYAAQYAYACGYHD
jgi:hypothetical protein